MPINRCKIVMYHFVRELDHTRYPCIKARKLSEFRSQLKYLDKNFEFVTVEDCIESIYEDTVLPDNAALLTFDDGYIDHYENVFPILEKNDIQGCFFPPAKAVMEDVVLDVNKIHFILAAVEDEYEVDGLVEDVFDLLDRFRNGYDLKSNERYYSELAVEGRYDPEEIIFIKRLLQRELPEKVREKIVDELFKRYVGVEEKVFSNELYMNMEQLRCMQRNGMHIGSHGYNHLWLNSISQERLNEEIHRSVEFLKEVSTPKDNWTFCYPYGAHDAEVRELLVNKGFRMGFITDQKIAELDRSSAMELPRVDTNEIDIL
ncbi:MAG: polysaccharide deacetylase family protein [Thermoplasmatota archaeon]